MPDVVCFGHDANMGSVYLLERTVEWEGHRVFYPSVSFGRSLSPPLRIIIGVWRFSCMFFFTLLSCFGFALASC